MVPTSFHRAIQGGIILAALCATPVAHASISQPSREQLQQDFHHTFQLILANPADIDMTMHYAELAIKLKDYEAAIPALERVLMFNPNLADTKLQLGVLYYKLDSHDLAKAYFIDAKKTKHASPEVVAKADDYLRRM